MRIQVSCKCKVHIEALISFAYPVHPPNRKAWSMVPRTMERPIIATKVTQSMKTEHTMCSKATIGRCRKNWWTIIHVPNIKSTTTHMRESFVKLCRNGLCSVFQTRWFYMCDKQAHRVNKKSKLKSDFVLLWQPLWTQTIPCVSHLHSMCRAFLLLSKLPVLGRFWSLHAEMHRSPTCATVQNLPSNFRV